MRNLRTLRGLAVILFGLATVACAKNADFGYLPDSEIHEQNRAVTATQLDILWVIDNSLSMEVSQERLARNFQSFIDGFRNRPLDYQMAVTTTEAFRDDFLPPDDESCFSCLHDGNAEDGPSGYRIVTPDTPNMREVFLKNMMQGVLGTGDERALQSIRSTLKNPMNSDFFRPGSYLAVIIISDEDDFSHDGSEWLKENYEDERLESVDNTLEYLDLLSRGQSTISMYSISTITVPDQGCRDKIVEQEGGLGQRVGHRHMEAASRSGGLVGSLCDEFSDTLEKISGRLLELITRFPLGRRADPSTIKVFVNDKEVPRDILNGWSYSISDNSIRFHGDAIPEEGARIKIDFIPTEIRGR